VINSFKMQEESRAARKWFHAIIVLAILLTVVASCVMLLYTAYNVGAGQAHSWFSAAAPADVFDKARAAHAEPSARPGAVIDPLSPGRGLLVLSIIMRRRFFWWLHPIGLCHDPESAHGAIVFLLLIGWLCKKITVRYGGRHMFAQVRPLFIGLFMGRGLRMHVLGHYRRMAPVADWHGH